MHGANFNVGMSIFAPDPPRSASPTQVPIFPLFVSYRECHLKELGLIFNSKMTAGDIATATAEDKGLSDTQLRYLGYVGRLGRLVKSVSRYLAYTSDIGEAFRPIVPPNVVKAAYAISWLYVGTDVSVTGYQESKVPGSTGSEIAQVCTKRAVFQSLACT